MNHYMGDSDNSVDAERAHPSDKGRDMAAWANVAVAGVAVLVSIVSLWTTVQISGLEDYFHSEISRRNADLKQASLEARALSDRVQKSTERLEELRSIADRYSAASAEAQLGLIEAQQELRQSNAGLQSARMRLTDLQSDIAESQNRLDEFKRKELFQEAIFRFAFFRNEDAVDSGHLGEYALNEIMNFGLSNSDVDAEPLVEAVRTKGARLCRHLKTFNPKFPSDQETPDFPMPPGKPLGDGRYRMTERQANEWDEAQADWKKSVSEVWDYNSSIRDARFAAFKYIRESAWHCACVALEVEAESCKSLPERPDIQGMIKKTPAV